MCGRYSLTSPLEAVQQLFDVTGGGNLAPRYNIAPTQTVPVVRRDDAAPSGRELAQLAWGLVPSWAKDPTMGARMINARAETVAEKPSFRSAYRRRRCLVPADGFYEWKKENGGKQPYRIAFADNRPFAFAGLWEHWQGRDGSEIESFTIITTEANDQLRPIHHRMPVILDPGAYGAWLEVDNDDGAALLKPYAGAELDAYPVSRHVNSPRNDDAECIQRNTGEEPPAAAQGQLL